ncbi:MAG TPA: HK97 family phage prohead protease [Terracidiphilus sp.]|jgi:hypothetical protein
MTQKTPQRELRYMTQEFRVSADGESPKIFGYAAVFNSPAQLPMGWAEEIDPHAFDSVMASNPDVRALWNHNPDFVLGRTAAGTLRVSVDTHGLAYEVDPPDTQAARDLMVSMRRGDVTQSSFGFVVRRDQWTEINGEVKRLILEMEELFDVSPVTYPAYPTASSGVRSLPASMPAELRSRFAKRDDEECMCDCAECLDGDCSDCSDVDCSDPNCICNAESDDEQVSARAQEHEADENLRMRIRLGFASLL